MLTREYFDRIRQDLSIEATLAGHPMRFRTTWGLFSPREIDEGTHLLMRHIEVGEADNCLDLGCGYGPIGLTLAKMAPRGKTALVDKDFLAVEYSRRNAELNGLSNCEAFLSNGFSQVGQRRFDLIASNIPAKVGKEMLYLYLYDALQCLEEGGRFYVVTITGLRKFMAGAFNEVFGNYKKVKQGKTYTVAYAEREANPALLQKPRRS